MDLKQLGFSDPSLYLVFCAYFHLKLKCMWSILIVNCDDSQCLVFILHFNCMYFEQSCSTKMYSVAGALLTNFLEVITDKNQWHRKLFLAFSYHVSIFKNQSVDIIVKF